MCIRDRAGTANAAILTTTAIIHAITLLAIIRLLQTSDAAAGACSFRLYILLFDCILPYLFQNVTLLLKNLTGRIRIRVNTVDKCNKKTFFPLENPLYLW